MGRHGSASRQHRWAARENARRQAEYAVRLRRWERVEAELDDLFRIAHGDPPQTIGWPGPDPAHPDPAAPVFVPRHGERVLYRARDLSMVWTDRPAGSQTAGFGGYSALAATDLDGPAEPGADRPEAVPESGQAVERGWTTVTDQRVIFHGAREWVWELSGLVLVEHSRSEPVTLLHVANREPVTGLRYAGGTASVLRFALVLAVSQHAGDGERLRAALRADRERHAARRPTVPAVTGPEGAPGTAALALDALRAGYTRWRGQSRRWRMAELIGSLAITILVVVVVSSQGAPPGGLAEPGAPGTPHVSPLLPATAGPTDSTTPPPTASAGPTTTHVPDPPSGTAVSPTATGAAARSADLCGAPANPYGYNLCGRGSPVDDWPPQVCSYFTCVADFGESGGHLVECGDHMLSTSGATGKGCAHHRGAPQTVFAP